MRGRSGKSFVGLLVVLIATILALVYSGPTTALPGVPHSVFDFSGGMNTASSFSKVAGNQFYRAQNWLLDDPDGAATVRPGYVAVTDSLAAYSKIASIYGTRHENGDPFLFQLLTTNSGKYGNLFVSDKYGYSAQDSLYPYIYPTRGHWLTWLDYVFYFNGKNPAVMVAGGPDKMFADALVPPAPGQLSCWPLDEGGTLAGEYIYGIVAEIPGESNYDWAERVSTLSLPVMLDSQTVYLRSFTRWITSSTPTDFAYSGTPNNAEWQTDFLLVRTRANCLSSSDSLFVVDTLKMIDTSEVQTLVYKDTISDTNLTTRTNCFWKTIQDATTCNSDTIPSLKWNDRHYALGQPSFLAYSDSCCLDTSFAGDSTYCDTVLRWCNYPFCVNLQWVWPMYVEYVVTYLDTLTGRESDTSVRLSVAYCNDSGLTPSSFPVARKPMVSITIGLPPVPSSRYSRVIYRQMQYLTYDGISSTRLGYGDTTKWVIHKTTPGGFYCLDTVKNPDDTSYVDKMSESRLTTYNDTYVRQVSDKILKGAIIHEERMFAWDDHRVYYSQTADPFSWGLTDYVEFGTDEGDRIVYLASYDGYIIVYMTNSIYILYTDDGTVYSRSKKTAGVGMVAPFSMVRHDNQNFFLSKKGLSYETGNIYREQSLVRGTWSDPVKNLIIRALDSMGQACAVSVDDRLLLSYPGTDSSFVFSLANNAWGVWTFDFSQGVLYDTMRTPDYTVSDQLCFIKDDDERIFVLVDSVYTDDGKDYQAVLEKWHIAQSVFCQSMQRADLWIDAAENDSDSVVVAVFDEEGDSLLSVVFDSLDRRFERRFLLADSNAVSHWFNVRLTAPNRENITVEGMTFYVSPAGEE